MTKLISKDFTKKYNIKNDTLNEKDLQRVYTFETKPRDSIITRDRIR